MVDKTQVDQIARPGRATLAQPGQNKPAGTALPSINWSHPLANGLVFYGYDMPDLTAIVDLVSGNIASSNLANVITQYGPATQYAGTPRTFASSSLVGSTTAAGNYTWACGYFKNGTAAAYAQPFGRTANSGLSQPFNNWDFEINPASAGQTTVRVTVNNNGTQTTSSNFTVADNAYQTLVGILTGSGVNGATLTHNVNGVQAGSSEFNITPNNNTSGDNIQVGGIPGCIFYGAFWARPLSQNECQLLHTDPYCFLTFDTAEEQPPLIPWYMPIGNNRKLQYLTAAYEDDQLSQEWSELQRLRNYRTTWQIANESVSKFVQYDVLTTPTAAVAVSKFSQYDVLTTPSASLSVSKVAQYVVLQPTTPTTNTSITGVGGTGQVGTVSTNISSQTTLTGVAGTGGVGTVVGDPSSFTLWSGTDLVSTTLDATHLVATGSSTAGAVRALSAQQSGKNYFECTLTTVTGGNTSVGIAAARATLATLGATPTAAAVVYRSGVIWVNNVSTAITLSLRSNGDVICIAIDFDNQYIWFRVGAAGNWNNSASANPATTTGGISIAGIGLAQGYDAYPVATFGASSDRVTANFGASAFTGTVPSGFTSGIPNASLTTNAVATQVGAEVFYSPNNAAVQLTQIGAEVFYAPTNSQYQLTQAGLEVWAAGTPSYNVTQVGLEVWASVTLSPTLVGVTGYGMPGQPFGVGIPSVSGSGACGALTFNVQATPSGAQASGLLGSVLGQFVVTGASGTGQAGTVTPSVPPAGINITGVTGTAAVGSMLPSVAASISGVAGTGAVGAVAAQLQNFTNVTGVAGSGAVGMVAIEIDAVPAGIAGTGRAGSLSDEIDLGGLTGMAGTGAIGAVAAQLEYFANVTGIAGSGAVNTFAIEIDVVPSGVAGTGRAGSTSDEIDSGLTGAEATTQTGIVIGTPEYTTTITGVEGFTPYYAQAVHVDGTTFWAQLAGNLTTADSSYYSFSGWIKFASLPSTGNFTMLYDIQPPGAESGPYVWDAGQFGFEVFNPSSGDGFAVESATGLITVDGQWHHLFGWIDGTVLDGKVYVDGVDVTFNQFPTGSAPQVFPFNGLEFDFPDDTSISGAVPVVADYADWWIGIGVLATDPSVFRDPDTGQPRSPVDFPATAFLLTGNTDNFLLNATGSQGALTVQTGSLIDADSSPSEPVLVTPSISKALTGIGRSGTAGTTGAQDVASLNGVVATADASDLATVSGQAVTPPAVFGIGLAGDFTESYDSTITVTGASSTGAVGVLQTGGDRTVTLADLNASSGVGRLRDRLAALGSTVAAGAAGNETVSETITLTGRVGAGQVGHPTASHDASPSISGVGGHGVVGTLVVAHPQLQVTQLGAETFLVPDPDLQSTQIGAEVFMVPDPALQASQVGVEAYVIPDPAIQTSQIGAEVFLVPDPILQVSQIGVEVFFSFVTVINVTETISGVRGSGGVGTVMTTDVNQVLLDHNVANAGIGRTVAAISRSISSNAMQGHIGAFEVGALPGVSGVGHAGQLRTKESEVVVMFLV